MSRLKNIFDSMASIIHKQEKYNDYEEYYEEDDDYSYEKELKNAYGSAPSGCRACGGPYPLCRDSCPVFDD